MIHIFHPPADNQLTGGYLYNLRVCDELEGARVHDVAVAELADVLAAHDRPGAHLLVDSLYIDDALDLDAVARCAPVALIHDLPSLAPGFPDRDRADQARRERAFVDAARRVVVTSGFMREMVREIAGSRPVHACPPGVDAVFFAVEPGADVDARPQIVTVANLEPRKGHLEHIEPLARLAAEVDFHWHLVGAASDPAYAARLHRAIERAGLAPRVTVHGRLERDALCALLSRASVHLFPSRFESYGMAVAESLAAGVPVIAPRLGELARLVGHGDTGLLAAAGDPHALIAELGRVLRDRALRDRLRAGCLARRPTLPRWPDAARRLRRALQGRAS